MKTGREVQSRRRAFRIERDDGRLEFCAFTQLEASAGGNIGLKRVRLRLQLSDPGFMEIGPSSKTECNLGGGEDEQ